MAALVGAGVHRQARRAEHQEGHARLDGGSSSGPARADRTSRRRSTVWHSGDMPESADEVYARVVAAAGVEGRLPTPPMAEWDVFPWESVDGAVVPKVLPAPAPETPREGEPGGRPCWICAGAVPEERIIWEDEHWLLTAESKPTGLPLVVVLWPREHVDFGDLGDDLAAERGRISNRLTRIIQGRPHGGGVHVNRGGDGSSHFHLWFFARPAGLAAVRGSYAVEWDDILPPGPEDVWRADLHAVATRLANTDGTARA